MNISKQTIEALTEIFSIAFYDNYMNEIEPSKATELRVGFDKSGYYVGKTIKATKKETTFQYVMDKLNTDNTFKNFSKYFNSIISRFGINAYPTTYGIGVFVAFGYRNSIAETKSQIEETLNSLGVKFSTEYSESGWIFRYKISKSAENINIIQSFANDNTK